MTDKEFITKHFRKLDTPPSAAQIGIKMHQMFEDIASKIGGETSKEKLNETTKHLLDSMKSTRKMLSEGGRHSNPHQAYTSPCPFPEWKPDSSLFKGMNFRITDDENIISPGDFLIDEKPLRAFDTCKPQSFTVDFQYTRPYATSFLKGSVTINATSFQEAQQMAKEKFPTITEYTNTTCEDD